MPTDTLGDEVQAALKGAADVIRQDRPDDRRRRTIIATLESLDQRLNADITERANAYAEELRLKEDDEIAARWRELNENQRFVRDNTEQKARQQTFDSLRQVNDGAFPTNISPVIYVIPLIGVGVAEWYVNLSTFMARFVPLVAGAGTILVAAIFATASHLQGEFLKQISEVLHPSVVYRNELGRKIALVIATLLLAIAFGVIVWLRYEAISDQLGLGSGSGGTFGGSNASMVWSNLAPTIGMNLFIWGLGVLYAFMASEKVPRLRGAYRALLRANAKLEKVRKPFTSEQKRIQAFYERERHKNDVAMKEYSTLLEELRGTLMRLRA
jgi:hypothetical protein